MLSFFNKIKLMFHVKHSCMVKQHKYKMFHVKHEDKLQWLLSKNMSL